MKDVCGADTGLIVAATDADQDGSGDGAAEDMHISIYVYIYKYIIFYIYIYIDVYTGPRGPGETTRTWPTRAQGGPQGPGQQGPRGPHKGLAHKGSVCARSARLMLVSMIYL